VSFYSRVIFPRLCDFLLDNHTVADQRRQLLALARGDVLEIGFGTGLNLPHYPSHIRKLTAVDPNAGMRRRAQRRLTEAAIELDHHALSGEQLPFEDGRFDCVVSTFTLCSIEHVDNALSEVFRVLKPSGRFLFLEHGLSPDVKVQRWQRRLNWLQMRLGDGCHLDRPIDALVAAQPFSSLKSDKFYVDKTPKTHGYIYRGLAEK
jgi:ubiquinone/menaquinone biosynthesis C-methylase UbiE